MMKKIGIWLLAVLIAAAIGVRVYRLYEARRANNAPVVYPPTMPPSGGASSGGSTANPPGGAGGGGEKGSERAEPAPPAFSPRAGETLEFAANVTKLNSTVATLRVVTAEKRNMAGKTVWHLQAFAHTENPYRMVFELDDQFDSYSEAGDFVGVQYEMHLSERGQKADVVERMTSSGHEAAPGNAAAARVLPGTRDPLGMLMYLREVDWAKTTEVRCPVFEGRKLYDVRAVAVGKGQSVTVPAGKFVTTKIEIHVLDNGTEMKDAHFWLYLTNTPERLPVLMEATLPVATARVELTARK